MTRKPNNYPMSMDEMVEMNKESKGNKLYRAQSLEISDERISNSVAMVAKELSRVNDDMKLDLTDTDRVKERTIKYLQSCDTACTFPTVTGLARSFGMCRNTINQFMRSRPNHATTLWLEMVKESFSDILSENGLRNNCNNIVSIFLLKSQYGFRESVEIVNTIGTDITDDDIPLSEIQAKYSTQMIDEERYIIPDEPS